jgi:crossover junction endodeoxyribonuclease RuvC
MIKLLLGLTKPPSPHDAADALAVAICHLHSAGPRSAAIGQLSDSGSPIPDPRSLRNLRTWRDYRPPANG